MVYDVLFFDGHYEGTTMTGARAWEAAADVVFCISRYGPYCGKAIAYNLLLAAGVFAGGALLGSGFGWLLGRIRMERGGEGGR
jgi:hypothetical protein